MKHCPSCHHPKHGMIQMDSGYWTCTGCGHHETAMREPRQRYYVVIDSDDDIATDAGFFSSRALAEQWIGMDEDDEDDPMYVRRIAALED